ncbi:MAG: hypothetical protein R2795_05520 [Saprospiraceae bacterium]
MNANTSYKMRVYHRYLGFFLVGIMAVYSISGILMIFRNTDTFKIKTEIHETIQPGLTAQELGPALKIKRLEVKEVKDGIFYFKDGTYNPATGQADYTKKELPFLLEKMERMHKATTESPLFYLNIFFGLALLFFVISSFWMFMPGTTTFKKGLYLY